jgi:putative tricarboxylic transport membrane protein
VKRGWQAAVAVLLLVFAFFGYESLQLSLRDALGPGPGFFPFWLSVAGGVLALILLVQVSRGLFATETDILKFELGPVALVLAGLVGGAACLELLGFRVAMLLMLGYLLLVLGVRNWLAIGVFAAAGSFGVYYVFTDFLKVPLP